MYKTLISLTTLTCLVATSMAQDGGGFSTESPNKESGVAYVLTNATTGNAVVSLIRKSDGTLAPGKLFPTLGLGTGATGSGSGSLAMSDNGRYVYAVNGGSNSITLFKSDGTDLDFSDVEPSGGINPVSIAVSGNLAYVLNAGNSTTLPNIQGFIRFRGSLVPLPGASWNLSAIGATPTCIRFDKDGDSVIVTEKVTNLIDVFQLDLFGRVFSANFENSAGPNPFGFDLDEKGRLFVAEASNAAGTGSSLSSYKLKDDTTLETLTASSPTDQAAACWVSVSKDGKFAYTSDAHTTWISGFAISTDGTLKPISPEGKTAFVAKPLDSMFDSDGKYFYVLSGTSNTVIGFRQNSNGSLTQITLGGNLPASAEGLIVR